MASIISNPIRNFLPADLEIDSWEKIVKYYDELKNREILSPSDFGKWLKDISELSAFVSEDLGWRYIRNSCDTTDLKAKVDFEFFISQVQPRLAPYEDALNRKLLNCVYLEEYLSSLSSELREAYRIYIRGIKKQVEIFREENIPLYTEVQTEDSKYAEVVGEMTIDMDGKEFTLQQAANFLRENDRKLREDVYYKINARRLKDQVFLDELFTRLVKLRHQIGLNAGFANYRDYMFASLGRFDYNVKDCFDFHDSIASEVLPLNNDFDLHRKKTMGLEVLKPWDLDVDLSGEEPIKPFQGGKELIEKTIECFTRLHPYLGECIQTMYDMKRVDLESRKGKAPGGYNYPLYETGVPFVFMNSVDSMRDLITMVHEGGHAVHSFLTIPQELLAFKDTPSEVSELASMSMELLSMEHWDVFMPDKKELRRAKLYHLEKIISILPWIATVDKFQHWIYLNPEHTILERSNKWKEIAKYYSGDVVDYTGQEDFFNSAWQRQLHLYQVPFYYIEYGMAQLGAIAVWRNYKKSPETALQQYMAALKLGYTQSIGEIYKIAGIKFDFSKEYIRELVSFVKAEIERIEQTEA